MVAQGPAPAAVNLHVQGQSVWKVYILVFKPLGGNSMFIIGSDISKKRVHSALLMDPATRKVRPKATDNSAAGHAALLDWAQRTAKCGPEELHFIVEATGVYHEPLTRFLTEQGARVSVVNPLHAKRFAESHGFKTKTDGHDRLVLALFGHERQPPAWQPLPAEIAELKSLLARLDAVQDDLQRERNRLEKVQFAGGAADVLDSITRSIDFHQEQADELVRKINDHIDRHTYLKEDRQHLESIPGVGEVLSRLLLLLYHTTNPRCASQYAAYAGVVPIQFQSGTSVHKPSRMAKNGNARLRAALYMPAIVAKRWNPDVRALYERLLARGKAKMAAIGAAMRKLLHIAFGVLKHQTDYQPQVNS
jgi:transposase